MSNYGSDDHTVLAGIVPRLELWPIIEKQKWYHVPVEAMRRDARSIEYLAFYLSGIFGRRGLQVDSYVKVTRVDAKKRIEIFPDEPGNKNAQKEYYRFHFDEIKKLARPIINQERAHIVHIFTELDKLLNAANIDDLWNDSPLEDLVYSKMKERRISVKRQFSVRVANQYYHLDFALFCKNGKIDLECDGQKYHSDSNAINNDRRRNNELASLGWTVLRFSGKEINGNVDDCLNFLARTISYFGGFLR